MVLGIPYAQYYFVSLLYRRICSLDRVEKTADQQGWAAATNDRCMISCLVATERWGRAHFCLFERGVSSTLEPARGGAHRSTRPDQPVLLSRRWRDAHASKSSHTKRSACLAMRDDTGDRRSTSVAHRRVRGLSGVYRRLRCRAFFHTRHTLRWVPLVSPFLWSIASMPSLPIFARVGLY